MILLQTFEPKHSTHGFTIGRSILTNARTHLGASVVLNIDLENFFPSIHFGRVRGRFMAKPFKCPDAGATILAQLCCHDGALPQGAPTSPTVSNLISAGMDVDLQRFATERQCRYTRYADDITFSTTRRDFSGDVVSADADIEGKPVIGARLDEIIEKHGFRINRKKVRLQRRNQRQVVTGLKINRFPNPSRRLFSQIRAMLHALETFGLKAAQRDHVEHVARKHRAPYRGQPSFLHALRGKIEFVGAIRGRSSPAFIRFARKLRDLEPDMVKDWDVRTLDERITDALWVIESEATSTQGTGFFLKGVGFITCAHVVHADSVAFQATSPSTNFPVQLLHSEPTVDLAVCALDVRDPRPLTTSSVQVTKQGDSIILAGFPNYRYGDTPMISPGVVVAFRTVSTIKRMIIGTSIISGNSGGPVLNSDGAVIGVAVTGTDRIGLPEVSNDFGVIPIEALRHVCPSSEKRHCADPGPATPAYQASPTEKDLPTENADNPGVIAFPPLIWLINTLVSLLVHFFLIRVPIMNYQFPLICGIILLVLAATLALSALVVMRRAGTNVNPAEPALVIVRDGPYRFTRNPMYLAICILQVAIGFFLNDWITLLFVVPLFLILHYGVVLPEERYLTSKFGEPYLELKREVRRYF